MNLRLGEMKYGIALLAGMVSVFGFAPYYLFIAPLLALVVLFYLVIQARDAKESFWLGMCFGLGLYCFGIYWIYISLHDFGGMPWWFAGFCTFCLAAFMALFPALVTYVSKRLGWIFLSAPVLWGLSDWVRSWIFTGFPWLTLGYSQVPDSPLVGFAPVFGVYGVSVIAALLSAMAAYWLAKPNQSVIWRRNIIATTVILVVAGGLLKAYPWTTPVGEPISVALLQGNISQSIKWAPEIAQRTIDQYRQMVKDSDAQLIVLPETALPVVASQLNPEVKSFFTEHAESNSGDVLVGIISIDDDTREVYNSAISYGASPTQSYAKNHLVPFGEFIPLKPMIGWIYRDWLNMPLSDLARGGATQTPMLLGKQKVAVNVCYEDVFGEEVISQLPEATLMVNISNDAWYGQSFAADQHMQFSQARALETGRMMLRATNTGATAIIDVDGQVLAHAPHDVKTTLKGKAQGYQGATLYVLWGNWPFILFSFSVIGFLVFVVKRKKQ